MTEKMKILYVGACMKYINPAADMLQRALNLIGDVWYYGPGFVDQKTLQKGLRYFESENGPFDFAITTEQVIIASGRLPIEHLMARIPRIFNLSFPKAQISYLKKIADDWKHIQSLKVLSLLNEDAYSWTNEHVDTALTNADIILGRGTETIIRTSEMKHLLKEKWGKNVNNVYADFVSENTKKIVSFPHFVGGDEFYFGCHENRQNLWSIAGVGYRARKIAQKKLSERGIKFKPSSASLNVYRIGTLTGRLSKLGLKYSQYKFREDLQNSRISFTCGSVLQMPIRKFFEIPAAGCLLVCEPFKGMEEMGFENGKNFYAIKSEHVLDIHQFVTEKPEEAEIIAKRGQKLVITHHSVEARSHQLKAVIEVAKKGTFKGAYWHNGKFLFNR